MARLNALIAASLLLIASAAPRVAAAPAPAGASVQGNVWTARNAPIPHARVRLRNADTGRVAGTAQANEDGRFMFGNVEPGVYFVELVNETGAVLAVGSRFSIGAGETLATFVRLSNSPYAWLTGFFGNAAAAVTSGAASQGITAISATARPVSAGR